MSNRKISECICLRINVGNFQHIELTKYAEESIDFLNDEDRVVKEDQLTIDLVASLKRSLNLITTNLGKGVAEAQEVENVVVKKIPEWLNNNPIPNIANKAQKVSMKIASEQEDKKHIDRDIFGTDNVEIKEDKKEVDVLVEKEKDIFEHVEVQKEVKQEAQKEEDDLFENIDEGTVDVGSVEVVEVETDVAVIEDVLDSVDESPVEVKKVEKPVATQKDSDKNDYAYLDFDDDDLFK